MLHLPTLDTVILETRKRWPRALAGLLLTLLAVLHVNGSFRVHELDFVDRALYDTTVRWFLPTEHDERIVIVDIDEASLVQYGRFPWPRDLLAQLIDELVDRQKAAVVGLDLVMSEPERNPVEALLPYADLEAMRSLTRLAPRVDRDGILARSMEGHPVVLGYYFTDDQQGHRTGALPAPLFARDTRVMMDLRSVVYDGFGGNIPRFVQVAAGAGFFNPIIDPDGLVRAVPLLAELDGELYEAFSLAMVRTYLGNSSVSVRAGELQIQGERGQTTVVVDNQGIGWLPFFSSGGTFGGGFQYYSAAELLKGKVAPGTLADKIVLIGTTSPGLVDSRPTPVAASFPGVEMHANLVRGLLDGHLPHVPDRAATIAATVTAVVGVVLTLAMTWLGAVGSLSLAAFAALGLTVLFAVWCTQLAWIVPLGGALLLVSSLALLMIVSGYAAEGRDRRHLVRLFSEYLPPQLVHQLARDPDRLRSEGDLREMTVVFADLSGFTGTAERLPPSELRQLLNLFLTAMSQEIFNHGGTLDKYIGDAVMAFWGAPLPDERHAENAVRCGLAMHRAMERVNRDYQRRGWPQLDVGIGINSGPMRVGDMGSSLRRTYTVIGDAVNIAARLQEMSKMHPRRILVGERTVAAVQRTGGAFKFESLGPSQLHGRQYEVEIFAVLDPDEEPQSQAIRPGAAVRSIQ